MSCATARASPSALFAVEGDELVAAEKIEHRARDGRRAREIEIEADRLSTPPISGTASNFRRALAHG